MSFSDVHQIEAKLLAILQEVPDYKEGHHLGRPFLTAYQIAIEFARRHPTITEALGHPIGGVGSGKHYSLSTYVARILSEMVKREPDGPVEGGFLSNSHLHTVQFEHEDAIIASSLTSSPFTLSMFRLRIR